MDDPCSDLIRDAAAACNLGDYQSARVLMEEAAQLDSTRPDVWFNLGVTRKALGDGAGSVEAFHRSLSACGSIASALGQIAASLELFREQLAADRGWRLAAIHDPQAAAYQLGASGAAARTGRVRKAIRHLERAVRLDPSDATAWMRLGMAYYSVWDRDDALRALGESLHLRPDLCAHSQFAFISNFDERCSSVERASEHRRWGELYACSSRSAHAFPNDRNPDRPIRIGYVSAAFLQIPASCFLEHLLTFHSPAVELYCYTGRAGETGPAHHWRDISALTTAESRAMILDDKIDILVCVDGHRDERIEIFTERSAPVQVAYADYPNTSGIPAMDYRITDLVSDPPESAQALYTETLLWVPTPCYTPPVYSPPVGRVPARARGFVTFGCFSNPLKITDSAVRAWAEALRRVPESILFLHYAMGGPLARDARHMDPVFRGRITDRMAELGIPAHRLRFTGGLPHDQHLALYNEVDVALDTFPFTGVTTAMEALWMGVPLVTLQGDSYVTRFSAAVLTAMGLESLVAPDLAAYSDLAVDLANDLDRLDALRLDARARLLASPILDHRRFVARIEDHYREIWRHWCGAEDRRE